MGDNVHKTATKQHKLAPKYQLQIQRSRSSTIFEIKHAEEALYSDETDVMQALMRQEDDRGERCKPTKTKHLKQQMQRLTSSSRNLFSLFNRLGDSSNNSSRSLEDQKQASSLNSSRYSLQSTSSQKRQRTADLTRHYEKNNAKKHKIKRKAFRPTLQRTHAIGALGAEISHMMRSISDDSAVKAPTHKMNSLQIPQININKDLLENTQSTPNIRDKEEDKFACSSMSDSQPDLYETNSSTSEEGLYDNIDDSREQEIDEEEHAKIMELLQRCSSDEADIVDTIQEDEENALEKEEQLANDEYAWIQPGSYEVGDEYMPHLSPRHTLLEELKLFSHHIQVHFALVKFPYFIPFRLCVY